MKIYFAGSIRGGRDNKELYLEIINILKDHGAVLTEHVGDQNLADHGEQIGDTAIYQRDMDWVKEADVVIAEVSTPSLGVGYEIGIAERLGKKILCLYRNNADRNISAMISGNPNIMLKKYDIIDDIKKIISSFLK